MSDTRTRLTEYELCDLIDRRRSWWFEGIYEARAGAEQLGLKKWVIVSGHDNIVAQSANVDLSELSVMVWQDSSPAERFRQLWKEEFGAPRAPMVDVRKHLTYAAVIAALDSVPPGIVMDIIHVWAEERGHKSELIETLEGEQPNYTVRAHDLPPETPTVKVYTGREW